MVPGHDAGVRHVALDHRQPGKTPVPAPVRPVAGGRLRRPPRGPGRPGRGGAVRPRRSAGGPPTRPTAAIPAGPRRGPAKVHPRLVNDDLRSVAELLAFMAANQAEARRILGPLAAPWTAVTDAHAACWLRQVSRIPHTSGPSTTANYVDDHALAQITAALPLLGLPRGEQMPVTRGDGSRSAPPGLGDPQAMRMILLQILTGRGVQRDPPLRPFDCLSPATGRAVEAAQGEQIARFRYAQTKIDIAPDTILVDSEVVAIIEEQQQWVRDRFPGIQPGTCSLSSAATAHAASPTRRATYTFRLRCSASSPRSPTARPAGQAQPYPPFPAHQVHQARGARPARPRPAALCRTLDADDDHALRRPAGRARRAGIPGHRQAQGRRHPRELLPRRPRRASTCSAAPTGSCPTAGACSLHCRTAARETHA